MLRLLAVLKKFSEDKTTLIGKEMRDGGNRGFSWLKLRSPFAMMRTFMGMLKNSDHKMAQINRMDALTYSNYLQKRIQIIEKIPVENDKKQALLILHKEMYAQYDHFRRVDPRGRFTKILRDALAGENNSDTSEIQNKIYLLWPLYVTGKHDERYLENSVFNAQHAFEIYQNLLTSGVYEANVPLSENIFKTIFQRIKDEIRLKRPAIIMEPAYYPVDLDAVVQEQQLGTGKKLNSLILLGDICMGMELDPKRMEAFTVQSISENGYVYGKPSKRGERKLLADGWYQYVILAEASPDGSASKHDMRYFPCLSKSAPQNPNGSPPYKKYLAHSELAGALSVFAAGAFKIEKGVICLLDDASGHYEMKDVEKKYASLRYAKSKLIQLGLRQDKAFFLPIRVMPEMSLSAKLEKCKQKFSSAVFGFFSAKNPGLATYCENRPRLPKKLRNLEPDHQLRSPQDELLENSFTEKLSRR